MELSVEHRQILLDAARSTIRAALGGPGAGAPPEQDGVGGEDDPILHQPAGCFVTLHTRADHRLRGCVGRLDSREELIGVVRQSALSVLQDPRFVLNPVRLEELPRLELEITVIFPLEPAPSCLDFDPLDDGIYLVVNDRAGCFLPQVARETGWSREQLLARLCTEKLGLGADAWQGPAACLMTFKTLIIGPEPFVPDTSRCSDCSCLD